jgi:hypothetical protein
MASLALLQRRVTRALVREDIDPEEMAAWVASGEARLNRELRIRENLRFAALPVAAGAFVAPLDMLHPYDLRLTAAPAAGAPPLGPSRGSLEYVAPSEFSDLLAAPAGHSAPGFYTTHGEGFALAPWNASSAGLQAALWYFGRVTPLLNPTDTSAVLENYPDLYLSAVLIYGLRFYLEDDKALLKEGLVAQEIATLNDKFKDAKYGDGPLTARPARKIGGRHS